MNFEDPFDFDILGFVKKHYQYMTYGYVTQSQLLELYEVLLRTIHDNKENVVSTWFKLERHLRWRVFRSLKEMAMWIAILFYASSCTGWCNVCPKLLRSLN